MNDPIPCFNDFTELRKINIRFDPIYPICCLPDYFQVPLYCSLSLLITDKQQELSNDAIKITVDFINRPQNVIQIDLKLKLHIINASLMKSPAANMDYEFL